MFSVVRIRSCARSKQCLAFPCYHESLVGSPAAIGLNDTTPYQTSRKSLIYRSNFGNYERVTFYGNGMMNLGKIREILKVSVERRA